jgi:hypothetical protein
MRCVSLGRVNICKKYIDKFKQEHPCLLKNMKENKKKWNFFCSTFFLLFFYGYGAKCFGMLYELLDSF